MKNSQKKRWIRGACLVLALPLIYVASYFVLGGHRTGFTFDWSTGTARRYTWHDHYFPFDPWIYKPIARLEYRIRGERAQVVIEDGTFRGGQPVYIYGPFGRVDASR